MFFSVSSGLKLFSKLVKRSMIQEQGRAVMFHNAYIMSRQIDPNPVIALEEFCDGGLHLSGQHFTIRKSWHRDEIVFESIDFCRLRSLTVYWEWKSFPIGRSMKILWVLDLENTSDVTNGDVEDILKILSQLKFLSLRGCRDITRLLQSLGGLRQLQFLNVKHTSIVAIPSAVVNLEKLQYVGAGTTKSRNDVSRIVEAGDEYLTSPPEATITSSSPPPPPPPPATTTTTTTTTTVKASRCRPATLVSKFNGCQCDDDGVKVSPGIGKLKALHNLGVVNVSGAGGKATLKELKYLIQLRKLRVSGINREKWRELCCAISDHLHLKSISVRFSEDCLDDRQQLPKNLETLKLSGRVRALPEWLSEQNADLSLDVEMATSSQKDLDDLAGSPSADMLRILCVKPTEESISFALPERNLDVLRIDCTPTLQQVTFGSWAVRQLMVNCSSGLRVSGVEELLLLEEVWLMGSYGDDLVRDLRQKLDHITRRDVKTIVKLVQPATSC